MSDSCNSDLAARPRLYLAKYLSLFLRKHRPTCLQPCRDLRLRLNPALCLNLYLDLDLNLSPWQYRKLLAKLFQLSFQQLLASLYGSVFASKNA